MWRGRRRDSPTRCSTPRRRFEAIGGPGDQQGGGGPDWAAQWQTANLVVKGKREVTVNTVKGAPFIKTE